jgi:hypothetical protein
MTVAQQVLRDKHEGSAFPTNLLALSRGEGVDIIFFNSTQDFDGRFELCLGKPTIYVNTRMTSPNHPRPRFTLGHELGHYFLHRERLYSGEVFDDKNVRFNDSEGLEREANEFASECLLPSTLVLHALKDANVSVEALSEVAEVAKASVPATAIKLASVTEGCSCFFWIEGGVVRWSAPSAVWRSRHPWAYWHGRTPDASLAAKAEIPLMSAVEVNRLAWIPQARNRSESLSESAIRTPFGIMVLVVDPTATRMNVSGVVVRQGKSTLDDRGCRLEPSERGARRP